MFVQVGGVAVNLDLVTVIRFGENCVTLYFSRRRVELDNAERDAFLEWWEKKANVHVCWVEGE